MSRRTPGSWAVDWHFIVASDPTGVHSDIYIAEIAESDEEGRYEHDEAARRANAELIASAPDMLTALEAIEFAANANRAMLQAEMARAIELVRKVLAGVRS